MSTLEQAQEFAAQIASYVMTGFWPESGVTDPVSYQTITEKFYPERATRAADIVSHWDGSPDDDVKQIIKILQDPSGGYALDVDVVAAALLPMYSAGGAGVDAPDPGGAEYVPAYPGTQENEPLLTLDECDALKVLMDAFTGLSPDAGEEQFKTEAKKYLTGLGIDADVVEEAAASGN
ncbi:hypothetical protein OG331_48645 [Streptomyces sp. NBC_01017]|uniref:hypothetical protein n=1 Tax=Streptomyces sp. NBC_01017 TaxID=2903721 RepID=UPI00386A1ABD|nr:hypothetical protein OG331_03330 [Streptomyces sp. NBC_01017]WSV34898.1 hypothetical protein OG331_48645 [Streptomyces sp. NBC_01017]